MSALLSRKDQAVSVTDISRSPKKYFDRLSSGQQDRYVIMRNNAPEAVVLPVDYYEEVMNELEDLRVELLAATRLNDTYDTNMVSHEGMRSRFK